MTAATVAAAAIECADVVLPACEKARYRVIALPNRMRCVLISDPETEKAACACNVSRARARAGRARQPGARRRINRPFPARAIQVRAGSMSDPEDLPGLAHFLEHMLFYSSSKYPVEDEYSKCVAV